MHAHQRRRQTTPHTDFKQVTRNVLILLQAQKEIKTNRRGRQEETILIAVKRCILLILTHRSSGRRVLVKPSYKPRGLMATRMPYYFSRLQAKKLENGLLGTNRKT